jgi:probable HAF family extracellular repeat protein
MRYRIRRLGPLPVASDDIGAALSPVGIVAAWIDPGDDGRRAVVYTASGRRTLVIAPGYPLMLAAGINGRGQIVGIARARSDTRESRAWHLAAPDQTPRLLALAPGGDSASARALTDDGRIVGGGTRTVGGQTHALLWTAADRPPQDLGTADDGDFSIAQAIAAGGEIVGAANDRPGGRPRGFVRAGDGPLALLPLLPGGSTAHARAINDTGVIVGWGDNDEAELCAVVWERGRARVLEGLGDEPTSAWSVNNRGQIVGASATGRKRLHATLWEGGRAIDLNTQIPADSGWILQVAHRINDRGQVIGRGTFQGQGCLYRLDPAPTERIPNLTAADASGTMRPLVSAAPVPTVLGLFCGCAPCHRVARAWGELQRGGTLDGSRAATVVVYAGPVAEARRFLGATGLDPRRTDLRVDPKAMVATRLWALPCPRLLVLDPDRGVRYRSPAGLDPAALVAQAVDALPGA